MITLEDNIVSLKTHSPHHKQDKKPEAKMLNTVIPALQWQEIKTKSFNKSEKKNTTILFGGLSKMHDQLLESVLISKGYKAKAIDTPDKASMQIGKEFGNRGQCNPTYFTVGNLIKHLTYMRDIKKYSTEDIIKNYVFLTAGGCGPCRFGMYGTEYRKALQDAGFSGFRFLTFEQNLGANKNDEDLALKLNAKFFLPIIRGVILADVLNLIVYRIRPYELVPGATNKTLEQCKKIIQKTIIEQSSINKALKQCKKLLSQIAVNKLQAKPKVSIIGEFWAMTTEGDGNYHLHQFLESEGAECDIQPISNWILYMLWSANYDAARKNQAQKISVINFDYLKKRLMLKAGKLFIEKTFYSFSKKMGLNNYALSDMEKIAGLAKQHYHNELRGGEGHMEVGKLIDVFKCNKAHLVISVKPFGCMPSSGVSDGVQSLVTKKYPNINFLAIETSGDGEVNIHSRIQMALFKARKNAITEYDLALDNANLVAENLPPIVENLSKQNSATFVAKHQVAGTAANLIYSLSPH